MPVSVVMHYPRRYYVRQAWRGVSALIGSLLSIAGIAASVVAVPLTVVVALFVLARISGDTGWDSDLPPKWVVTLVWAIATAIMVLGRVVGRRMLQGSRELVLFLRRFGYDEATRAVTFAAAKTIGRSWRLVTLDDAEITPVGVSTGPRRLFHAGSLGGATIAKAGRRAYSVVSFAIPAAWIGMLGIAGITYLRHKDLQDVVVLLHLPRRGEAIGWSLQGAFYVLAAIIILMLALAILWIVLTLLGLVLMPVGLSFQSTAEAVRRAEKSRRAEIHSSVEIEAAVASVAELSHKTFAPRLIVLTVSSSAKSDGGLVPDVWKQTVRRLSTVTSVLLLDVSEPTENLLWEIRELREQFRSRCVIVGHYDRVRRLAANGGEAPTPESLDGRLRILLDGQEVLAYTTDRRGMRRFARALRNKLQTASLSVRDAPPKITDLRRGYL